MNNSEFVIQIALGIFISFLLTFALVLVEAQFVPQNNNNALVPLENETLTSLENLENKEKLEFSFNNIIYKAKISSIIQSNEAEVLIVESFNSYKPKTLIIEEQFSNIYSNQWVLFQQYEDFNDFHGKYLIKVFDKNSNILFKAYTIQ